jgi:putative peptidoglycan lipid II flippase
MNIVALISSKLAGSSVKKKILRAAIIAGSGIFLVRIAIAAKEIVAASVFGRSDTLDAFLLAVMIPTFLATLLSESMNQALVPKLIEVRERQGKPAAERLASGAICFSTALLLVIALALAAVARPLASLVFTSFSPSKLDLAIHLFYITLPVAVFSGVASNCAAVLNTTGKFAFPALIRILSPVLMIAAALTATRYIGIFSLAFAMLFGAALEAASLMWLMARHGYPFRPRRDDLIPSAHQVGAQYGLMLITGALTTGVTLADQSMTATLAPGSLSALVYGSKPVAFLVGLLSLSIATSMFPYYSEMIAKRDWDGCHDTITTYAKLTALVTVPIMVFMILGSHFLVRVIFQHGAFSTADTEIVARVQAMYAIQIPFIIVGRVFNRFLVAMKRNDLVLICGGVNLTLDIILNLVLMRLMGVSGIALATSLFAVSSFFFNAFWAFKLVKRARLQFPCPIAVQNS